MGTDPEHGATEDLSTEQRMVLSMFEWAMDKRITNESTSDAV